MGTLAILLNKLIATLHQANFFFYSKRVDYYYREQWIIICGPNLKISLSLRLEANKRRALQLWAVRKAALGELGSEPTKDKAQERPVNQLTAGGLSCLPL